MDMQWFWFSQPLFSLEHTHIPVHVLSYFGHEKKKQKNKQTNKKQQTERKKTLRMTVVYHVLTTIYCFSQAIVSTYVVNKNKTKMGIKRKETKR